LQELHQGKVFLPVLQWNSPTDLASRERLGLHLQIHFRINVRGIERNVTQPGADGVNVHASTEKMGRPPAIWAGLRKRQQTASEEAKEIAWKAQHRLHKRYARLAAKGKDKRKIVTAVGRELLGFIWAIGTRTEANAAQRVAA
jgi:hypothetical protein